MLHVGHNSCAIEVGLRWLASGSAVTITIGIFASFELGAFELANRLITIAPEHCIPFEHSLTKARLRGIVDGVVVTRK